MSVIISLDQAKVTGVAVFDNKKLIKHTSINSNEDDYEKVIFDIVCGISMSSLRSVASA